MVWMGSKANIATITALSVTDLEDGIVFYASAEKTWLALAKTDTTSTANSKSCYTATGGVDGLYPEILQLLPLPRQRGRLRLEPVGYIKRMGRSITMIQS